MSSGPKSSNSCNRDTTSHASRMKSAGTTRCRETRCTRTFSISLRLCRSTTSWPCDPLTSHEDSTVERRLMESLHETCESYRLIVTRRDASEILLSPNGPDWALPRVEIHQQRRVAEQLVSEISREWGLPAYCLFVPSLRTPGRNGNAKCAVM